jgi:hypothetical protein
MMEGNKELAVHVDGKEKNKVKQLNKQEAAFDNRSELWYNGTTRQGQTVPLTQGEKQNGISKTR